MKKTLLINLLTFVCYLTIHAQAVYVDSNIGNDNNEGTEKAPVFSINKAAEIIKSKDNGIYTMKINPGIYILEHHVSISTEKEMTNKRIVIEASVLPDDSTWTPEKMPIIITKSKKGEIMEKDLFIKDNWITSFYINESHVTIRGIKFLGSNYPVNCYYPIARFNKEKTDLLVEQCMFLGSDLQTSVIQVGVIAHGDEIKVNHCVFYNANNAAIYWKASGTGSKTGNSMTNCIVYGATISAVWTASPDKDFIYKNNIVTNCNFFWIKEASTTAKYSIDSCVIVNNQHYKGDGNLNPSNFALNENNIIKEGKISLRMINSIWEPWPIDHLHIIPNTLGYNLGAGLFKHRKQ
jgi:hypothetical protein